MDFRVSMPAIVLEVNEDQSLALIAPAFKDRVMGQERLIEYEDMEPIADVPIAHYSSNKGYVLTKVEEGCHGEIHFCDFDLQNYVETGEISDLASSRFHDYGDCFFVPGGFAYARRIDPIDADIGISSIDGLAGVHIKDGALKLYGSPVMINDVPVLTVNAGTGPFSYATPVPEESTAPPKEVRR